MKMCIVHELKGKIAHINNWFEESRPRILEFRRRCGRYLGYLEAVTGISREGLISGFDGYDL